MILVNSCPSWTILARLLFRCVWGLFRSYGSLETAAQVFLRTAQAPSADCDDSAESCRREPNMLSDGDSWWGAPSVTNPDHLPARAPRVHLHGEAQGGDQVVVRADLEGPVAIVGALVHQDLVGAQLGGELLGRCHRRQQVQPVTLEEGL